MKYLIFIMTMLFISSASYATPVDDEPTQNMSLSLTHAGKSKVIEATKCTWKLIKINGKWRWVPCPK